MNNLIIDALQGFEDLAKDNSRVYKLMILKRHSGNEVFKRLLELAYNPFKMYYIKKIPTIDLAYISIYPQSPEINFRRFLDLLDALSKRVITGNEALQGVQETFGAMTDQEIKWYTLVLQKDLSVGIQAKTINKAIPGLVPTFGVILANPFRSYPDRFILQPKFDGMRLLASTTTGILYSRKGKVVEGFNDIEEEIRKLPSGYLMDGEILAGVKGEKVQSFNNLMSQAFRKSTGKQGILFAFDLIPESSIGLGGSPFYERTRLLGEVLSDYRLNTVHAVVSSPEMNSRDAIIQDQVDMYYNNWLGEGFEGLIVKDVNAPYERERSYAWQKIKPIKTFDLKVIGLEKGNAGTKYEDELGRLVCDFNGVEVRVGSGLSDEQRSYWWQTPDEILGKIVEIKAQETTSNKQGTTSLRFPRFKRVRIDK